MTQNFFGRLYRDHPVFLFGSLQYPLYESWSKSVKLPKIYISNLKSSVQQKTLLVAQLGVENKNPILRFIVRISIVRISLDHIYQQYLSF
jgi:chaperonin GroEL (HSP60 family)